MIEQVDLMILDRIQQYWRTPALDSIMVFITRLGDKGILFIVLALALLLVPRYRYGGILLSVGLILNVILCNLLLKPLLQRLRPCHINEVIDLAINCPTDFSFPSGHSMAAFLTASILYHIHKKWGIAAFVLAVLMAVSRVYLYVHFPSDVIIGAVLGLGLAALVKGYLTDRIANFDK